MTINQRTRAQFLSLSCLQGLGRLASEKAMPPDDLLEEIGEWAAFKAMNLARSAVGGGKHHSGLSVFDENYRLLHLGSVPGGGGTLVGKNWRPDLAGSKRWLTHAAKLVAENPTKSLFVYYDTVMLMETDEDRAKGIMSTVAEKITSGEDGIRWLCDNGGKWVTVATMLDIGGVQSQLMFGQGIASTYGLAKDFMELISLVATNSTPLIDANMEFITALARSEKEDSEWYANKLIDEFNKTNFLWLDTIHSAPMMELLLHFGLGTNDEIEEAIGRQIVEMAIGDEN